MLRFNSAGKKFRKATLELLLISWNAITPDEEVSEETTVSA